MKAPPKLVCLESYWNEELFQHFSVKAFLDGMAPLIDPPLTLAHRFVDSGAGLAYYLRRPGGVMWRQKALFDAFADYGRGGYRNLVYFAACNVFRGKRGIDFARRFVKATGVQAVIGYATPVGWMASLVCDLLFLHRFYSDPSPWKNLRRIFNSVHRDYPAARRLKHLLITRKDVR